VARSTQILVASLAYEAAPWRLEPAKQYFSKKLVAQAISFVTLRAPFPQKGSGQHNYGGTDN
jgi:hypothetical protein